MPSDFEERTRTGDRRYPNGERMREEDLPFEDVEPDAPPRAPGNGRFLPAIVLVSIGVIFLLANLGLFHIYDIWHYWPLALIVSGVFKLSSNEHGAKSSATVLLIVGAVFLMMNLGLLHISFRLLWPLALVGAGLFMFTRSWGNGRFAHLNARAMPAAAFGDADQYLQNWAVFGGVKRIITARNFQGGELFAAFGGIEIDLRQAQIVNTGRAVVIDANAAFGGINIKVPDTWRVAVRGIGIFGGYQDEALKLRRTDPSAPLLVITGYAAFGGVAIE